MSMSNFSLNPELSVVCFRRENSKQGPFFAVREFDTKVLRTRDKGRGRGRGPSEQAIRASIRQAILNMNLKSERATKAEIRLLKGHGILGKRAPSCSLLCAEDMIKLLEAFGKDDLVRDLRVALAKDKKLSPPIDDYRSLKTQKIRKASKTKIPPQESAELHSGKRQRLDSPSRMDTLLSALLALSNTDSIVETTSSPTSLSSLSPVSPSLSVSPSKTPEQWSSRMYEIPSPTSPSLRIRDTIPDADMVPKPIPLSSLSTGLSFSTPTISVLRLKKSRPRLKTNTHRTTLSPPSIKVDTRRSYLPVSHISPPVSPLSSSSVSSHDGESGSLREEPSTPDSVNFPSLDPINFHFLPLPLESLALLSSLDPASLCSPQGFAPFQGLTEFQGLSTPASSGQVESQGFSSFLEPKDPGFSQVVLDHT